jgi:hypothetical protein
MRESIKQEMWDKFSELIEQGEFLPHMVIKYLDENYWVIHKPSDTK